MSFKAVFSDLDGTLLTSQHNFSPFTKRIVQEIQKRKLEFIIATGRHHLDVQNLVENLGIRTTIITSNGARIHNEKGELILKEDLDPQIAHDILTQFPYEKYPHVRANVYCGDSSWITNTPISEEVKKYHSLSSFQGTVGDLRKLSSYDSVVKIFFNIEKDQADYWQAQKTIKEVEKYLLDKYCDGTVITAPLPSILEINSPKATKGQAMKKVIREKGIELKHVIAFGDGFNDFDMLSSAGRGLIMGNAHYTLKEALPNLEVIETSDADGVAKYLVLNVLLET